jgi:cystathionine beta-lyase/cystathionine gamma-synthase
MLRNKAPQTIAAANGIGGDSLLRLSVGLESEADLLAGLATGLEE